MGDSLGVFLLSMLYCVTAIIYSLLSRKIRLSLILILWVAKGPLRRVYYSQCSLCCVYHQIDEKVFHMELHDFSLHWVESLYATCSIVTYTEEETEAFKNDIEAKNTKKSTATAVRRFRFWYEGKHHKELELNKITKQIAHLTVKTFHFRNSTDK